MSSHEIDPASSIRGFVLAHTDLGTLADDDDLFADRGIGSMFVMQLVLFVEKRFGIAVTADELSFDQFRSVAAIAGLVARKHAGAATPVDAARA